MGQPHIQTAKNPGQNRLRFFFFFFSVFLSSGIKTLSTISSKITFDLMINLWQLSFAPSYFNGF